MSLGRFVDDVLGIDPNGGGIFGSIANNPILAGATSLIPGVGPVAAGLIGSGANLIAGRG